jgi:DNA-binding GntR family transcriptional regulator
MKNNKQETPWLQDLKPVQRGTLSQYVYENLLQFILAGKIMPGEHLVEQKLADQLEVSRISVREAIRELSKDGLVELVPNSGAHVVNYSIRDIEEIYTLRAALESIAIEQLFKLPLKQRQIRLKKLEDMINVMNDLEIRGDRFKGSTVDTEFHRELMLLSGQVRAFKMWEQLSAHIHIIVYHASQYFPSFDGFTNRHQVLINLIMSDDKDACINYLKHHIMDGGQKLIFSMDKTNSNN